LNRTQRSAGVPPASVPGVPPDVVAGDMTPPQQSAFKKPHRKFRPIPALVTKATHARAKLNQ